MDRVEVFVVAEHLEDFRSLLQALLLDPGTEPVEEATQTELVLSVASVFLQHLVPKEVGCLFIMANFLHEVVKLSDVKTTAHLDSIEAAEQLT